MSTLGWREVSCVPNQVFRLWRNGPPSQFSLLVDAVTLAHQQRGVPREWFSDLSPMPRMYVDGWICVNSLLLSD